VGRDEKLMNDINPYDAPRTISRAPGAPPPSLGIARGFVIAVASGAAGSLLGLLAGIAIGTLAPDYYHAVFSNDRLNAVQVGAGLGLTQGFGVGLAVGCVVLLATAISRRRTAAAV
jgi:hypothetical protein